MRGLERLGQAGVVVALHYVLLCLGSYGDCGVGLQDVNVIVDLETVGVCDVGLRDVIVIVDLETVELAWFSGVWFGGCGDVIL